MVRLTSLAPSIALGAALALGIAAVQPAAAAVDCRQAEIGAQGNEEFNVLFGVGSSAIDATARTEVNRAADRIKGIFATDVCLVGRASQTGNAQANQRLSQARINAVKAALTQRGVRSSVVGSRALGASSHSTGTGTEASGERSVVIVVRNPPAQR
jgi:outer membrane protein OmpA-like peptidoglycan-associated protein